MASSAGGKKSGSTKEPSTGVEFPNSVTAAGAGGKSLSLVGAGVRERKIAFLKVKIYAAAFYVDASALADSSSVRSFKGKSGSDLGKDEGFFKALVDAPVAKAIKIVLARDVEGGQFWGALDEALTPRLKSAGSAGAQAQASLGDVVKGRPLKQGTSVILAWVQPSTLHVVIAAPNAAPGSGPDATIESAVLLPALFDVYLGKDNVSPTLRAAVASGFSSVV